MLFFKLSRLCPTHSTVDDVRRLRSKAEFVLTPGVFGCLEGAL